MHVLIFSPDGLERAAPGESGYTIEVDRHGGEAATRALSRDDSPIVVAAGCREGSCEVAASLELYIKKMYAAAAAADRAKFARWVAGLVYLVRDEL